VAKGKYDKYIITDKKYIAKIEEGKAPFFHVREIEQWSDLACSISFMPILKPLFMEKSTMKHEFDQVLCFLGGDMKNIFNFEGEVELSLGEEAEKQIITRPTVVYIPKGLAHCPLNFKRIDKPILFLDISLTRSYSRKEKAGGNWGKTLKDSEIIRD
jgi:hypothetical protein